ncbi:MAG TPA: UpxY family transcription antiterminator [Bacteroidales bacterium]|jgi:transcriptional antiterminator RfaH|nr:UpxY family transcription antiterminator [Bacteroidales bacterium]NLH34125.1 UpxY family transcription antiterminator [Lentimicrobium sp.]OQC37147.1 MAG: hypothetical protein BWX63_01304 [Bacteroidetes bacterium ADurb.Bin041]MBP7874221.1 UpxY family transcription antiterminator [Bacteroidales bacterium]MCZ2282914.1 UpxY family transcription antiterminator [Bacteroidales bacterium]
MSSKNKNYNTLQQPVWYVIYTAPRSEKKVYQRLIGENIETYFPTYNTIRQWSDRKKEVSVPLFNSYLFVKISLSDMMKVLKISGVIRFVYYLGAPAVVREIEIERIKLFLKKTEGYSISIEKGDLVQVSSGIMKGVEGVILRITKNKAIIQIEQLGLCVVATVPRGQLKKPTILSKQ